MDKKLIVVAPRLPSKPLSRRQVLEGFGALAIPIIGCSSDDGGPGDGTVGGAGSGQGGASAGSSQAGANTAAGSFSVGGGGAAAGSPGGAGSPMTSGGSMNTAGSSAGSSGSITGGTSPGGAPGAGAPGAGGTPGGAPGAGAPGAGAGGMNGGAGPMGGAGGSGGIMAPPSWEAVPTAMCKAQPTDGAGQGPFFIHDKEKTDDVSLFRQDIRGQYNKDAEPGIEMMYHLRVLDSTMGCMMPVKDVEVYIWHTDAQGFYSGFGMPGDQKPDEPYAGTPGQNDLDNSDRFCRGAQLTNADGVVSFRSIFPGWYNGRDVHIHLVIMKRDSMSRGRMTYTGDDHIFTTQLYFQPELTDMVHKSAEPYKRRTSISAYAGAIKADENGNSGLKHAAKLEGNIVVSQMQILLNPAASVGPKGGMFGF